MQNDVCTTIYIRLLVQLITYMHLSAIIVPTRVHNNIIRVRRSVSNSLYPSKNTALSYAAIC